MESGRLGSTYYFVISELNLSSFMYALAKIRINQSDWLIYSIINRKCTSLNWSIFPLYVVWCAVFFAVFHLIPTSYFIVSQEVQNSSQALQEEKEEVKRRLEEATARVIQLEEDLIGVTQKGLQKETELDRSVQDADVVADSLNCWFWSQNCIFYLGTRILKPLFVLLLCK